MGGHRRSTHSVISAADCSTRCANVCKVENCLSQLTLHQIWHNLHAPGDIVQRIIWRWKKVRMMRIDGKKRHLWWLQISSDCNFLLAFFARLFFRPIGQYHDTLPTINFQSVNTNYPSSSNKLSKGKIYLFFRFHLKSVLNSNHRQLNVISQSMENGISKSY